MMPTFSIQYKVPKIQGIKWIKKKKKKYRIWKFTFGCYVNKNLDIKFTDMYILHKYVWFSMTRYS
jgi:hypothetical protein